MSEYLVHHGIKGQKWGVRRFQNYDGSYTQAGLRRYNKAKELYDEKEKTFKEMKRRYKNNEVLDSEYEKARQEMSEAKRKMNTSYEHLKIDKRADKGRKLAEKGHTINKNNKIRDFRRVGAVLAGQIIANNILRNATNTKVARIQANYVRLGIIAANAAMDLATEAENNKLRAYYHHGRN